MQSMNTSSVLKAQVVRMLVFEVWHVFISKKYTHQNEHMPNHQGFVRTVLIKPLGNEVGLVCLVLTSLFSLSPHDPD